MYSGGQFILIGTSSGISHAPEGGAHQSVATPSIGIAQPRWIAWEPAFGPPDPAAPLMTVLDGHSHALAFLAAVRKVPISCLGVDDFDQSGTSRVCARTMGSTSKPS